MIYSSLLLVPLLVMSWFLPTSPLTAHEFEIPAIEGASVVLKKSATPTVVYFLGTECPLAKLYSGRLQELANQHKGKIRVIGVSSNQQDSIEELKVFVKKLKLKIEVGKDYQNKVADQFGATRTPEVFLLDGDLNVVYQGRVDDQYSPGISRAKATKHFLKDAVEELLKGQKIQLAKTDPVGCLIGKVRTPDNNSQITYCNQISRLLQKHCVECHRPGEIGPFALTDYEEVVGWADMMLEVVQQKRMPPWHASPDHGDFVNARVLTEIEKKLLKDWVAAGAPYGQQANLPAPKKFASGWNLSKKPDRVLDMKKVPFQVPAEGVIDYQYFVVNPKFKEDKWVVEAQVLPGNRSVVHHSIVFVRPPDGKAFRGIGWLSAYVPGQRAFASPKGSARFIPAGSMLVFQQHYTTTGTPQTDMTKIGLVFADESEIQHEVYTVAGIEQDFDIPANDPHYQISSFVPRLPKTGTLLSVSPHMHFRGKSFRAYNETEEKSQIICDVPSYDFNWQHNYVYRKPISLSEIGRLKFEVVFDNSKNNPFNPDPSSIVTWGDQTFEEMAVGFFDIAVPRFKVNKSTNLSSLPTKELASAEATEFVEQFFKLHDKNGNGVVERDETPISLRAFGFWKYDKDRDLRLTREEVADAAQLWKKLKK